VGAQDPLNTKHTLEKGGNIPPPPPPPPVFWPKFKVKEGRILSFYLPPSFFSKLLVFFKFLPHSFFFFTKNSFSCVFLLKFQPTIDGFNFFLKVKYGKE
jgi:hypothetical protein